MIIVQIKGHHLHGSERFSLGMRYDSMKEVNEREGNREKREIERE